MSQNIEQQTGPEVGTRTAFISKTVQSSAARSGPAFAARALQTVGNRGRADKSGVNGFSGSQMNLSNPPKRLCSCIHEVISLLRYSNFIPHDAVERWSRKLREINALQPQQGLVVLDELIGDYWAVFHSCKSAVQLDSEHSEFEIELTKLKVGFDQLGTLLLAAEPEDSVSA